MCDFVNTGGLGGPSYNTVGNTMGIGDPVSPGQNNSGVGSGDIFFDTFKPATKKAAPSKKNDNPFDMSPRPLIVPSSH